MRIEATTRGITAQQADAVVVGLFEGDTGRRGAAAAVHRALKGLVARVIASGEFKGTYCQTAHLHAPSGLTFGSALLIGLGKREGLDVRRLRGAVAAAARVLARKRCTSVALPALGLGPGGLSPAESVEALAEGLERSTFRLGAQKTEKKDRPAAIEEAFLVGVKPPALARAQRAIEVGRAIGAGANLARDLINLPGNMLSPEQLADRARAVAEEVGLDVDVLDEKRMKRLGMGALLSVGQGSSRPPRLVLMRHDGAGGRRRLGFVGKGITFDSGGISIKPSSGMWEMKFDMSGAAAVLGAMHAIGRLKPKARVLGVLACAENLPSGRASRPGDIVTARNGKTIEIISTDAEGRLVLADALAYAIEQGATHLLNLATLTGACIVALGHEASGLMTNDARWAAAVTRAAERAGERVWELPMFGEFRDDITSKVADIKNVGAARQAGTIAGGMFLKEFVGKTPWVHLDIAGTAWAGAAKPHRPEGPTGVGVATMVRLAL